MKANEQPHPFVDSPNFYPSNNQSLQLFLRIYPKGVNEQTKNMFVLRLYLASCDMTELPIRWLLSLLDDKANRYKDSGIFNLYLKAKLLKGIFRQTTCFQTENGLSSN